MRPRPYLRAYMAGIVIPTLTLLLIMSIGAYHVFYLEVPSQFIFGLPSRPLERTILFPMAVVPNLWGVWNLLWVATKSRTHLPIGAHGSVLPALLVPFHRGLKDHREDSESGDAGHLQPERKRDQLAYGLRYDQQAATRE